MTVRRRNILAVTALSLLYLAAIIVLSIKAATTLKFALPTSLLLLGVTFLVLVLTRRRKLEQFTLHRPLFGILVFAICVWLYIGKYLQLPEVSTDWHISRALTKLLLLVIVPSLYIGISEPSYLRYVFRSKNIRGDLKLTTVLLAVMVVPTFFYNASTWRPILNGEIPVLHVIIALPVSMGYFFMVAALPEELMFRAFIQEHLAQLLHHRLYAVVIGAMIFGYLHIHGIMRWHNVPLYIAVARATMVQMMFGLMFATIWERTRSVLPPLVIHTVVDGITNCVWIAERLFS